jgi:hypothetical protein
MTKKKSVIVLALVFFMLVFLNYNSFVVNAEDSGCCYFESSHECEEDITFTDCTALGGVFDAACESDECTIGCCVYQSVNGLNCKDTYSGDVPSKYFCEATYSTQGVNFIKDVFNPECGKICTENGILFGHVKTASGVEIEGAEISLNSQQESYSTISQSSGYYFFDSESGSIPAGTYTLVVSKTGYEDFETAVSVSGATEKNVVLQSQGEEETLVTISGRVFTKESQNTPPRVSIQNAVAIIPSSDNMAEVRSSPSDIDGRFVINNLPLGRYDVVVSATGKEPVMRTVEVTSDNQDIGEFFLPDLSQEAQAEGVMCCTWGCSDISLARSDLGDGGICDSGTGVYCTGSDDSVCLESANQCCEAAMFCDADPATNPAVPNVCSKRGKFGCSGTCIDPPDCSMDEAISSNKPDVLCKCGSLVYDTNMPGYCCENAIGNPEFAPSCASVSKHKIEGKIISELTGMPIKDAAIFITLKNHNWVDIVKTDANGRFSKDYEADAPYEIYFTKKDFENSPYPDFNMTSLPSFGPTTVELLDKGAFYIPLLKSNVDFGVIELTPEISSCLMPDNTFSPAKMLTAMAANKGSPELKLIWTAMNCPDLTKFEIYRRDLTQDGEDANFELIAILSKASFMYIDYDVLWEHKYEYEVWPIYQGGLFAETNSKVMFSTGNVSCQSRNFENKNNEFCSKYNIETGETADKPYYRYFCDDNNFQKNTEDIEPGLLKKYADCSLYEFQGNANKICVGPNEEGKTVCKELDDCGVLTPRNDALPFGLFYTRDNCYGSSVSGQGNVAGERYEHFCTFDRTDSVVDECKSCYPDIDDCSDYKGKDACEVDNCFVGKGSRCVWVAGSNQASSSIKGLSADQIDLEYADLGEGFCVREERVDKEDDSYCGLCSTSNSPFNANSNCNIATCQFLGNCFSDGEGCISCKNYNQCDDYKTQDECIGRGAGATGYDINTPGGLASLINGDVTDCSPVAKTIEYSTDGCGKNFCEWIPAVDSPQGGKCIKDGNDNGVSDCLESPLRSRNCLASNDPATLVRFKVEKSLALDGQIEFEFSKNLSDDGNHELHGFMYCVEDADNPSMCCPNIPVSPSNDYANIVFFNPEDNILGFKKENCNGAVNCYDHEGVYRIRYIAIDRDFNVVKIEEETVYLDLTPPVMNAIPNYLLNDTSTSPPRSAIEISIDLSEVAFCYDSLTYETGYKMSNEGDVILGNYSTGERSEFASMYFSTKYNNLEDGIYRYHLNCMDTVGNWDFKEWEFLVDAYKNIKILSPKFMGAIGPSDFIQDGIYPDVIIKSDDPAYACELIDVRTGLEVKIGNLAPTSPDLRDWQITSPFTGAVEELVPNKNYDGNLFVQCMDLDNWEQNGVVEWIDQDLRFVTDYVAPETKVFAESETSELAEQESGAVFLVNETARISFECKDPAVDGNDRYIFGCKETYYCLAEPGSKCTPDRLVSELEDETLVLESTNNICYRSEDEGGNLETPAQENIKCFSVIIDKEAPVITINTPSDLETTLFGTLKVVTSDNMVDLIGEIKENHDLESIEARIFNSINVNWVELPVAVGSSPQTYPFQKQWNLFSLGTEDTKYIVKLTARDKAGNVGRAKFIVYFDIEGPFAKAFELEQNGQNLTENLTVEYGQPFTITTVVDDEHWSEELSYLKMDLTCKEGPCVSQPVELLYDGPPGQEPIIQKSFTFAKNPTTNDFGVYDYKAGKYALRILAQDRYGYPLQKEFEFDIKDTKPTTITWDNSVSNITNRNKGYELKFFTPEPTECTFKLDIDPEYDNAGNLITDFYFPMESDFFKQHHTYTLERTLPDDDYGFTISCTELGGGNVVADSFSFKIDSQVPKLLMQAKGGTPNSDTQDIIQEYYFDSLQDKLQSEITIVDTNEENRDNIQCQYECYSPNSECPPSLREGYLGQWSYEQVQKQVFSFSNEFRPAGDYYFDIICKDEAGNVAKAPDLVFRIEGKSKIKILEINPGESMLTNDDPLELSAKTNHNLECEYVLNSGLQEPYIPFDNQFTTGLFHKSFVSDLDEKSYIYNVKCYDPVEPNQPIFSDDVYLSIDRTPPEINSDQIVPVPYPIPVISAHPFDTQGIVGYSYDVTSSPSEPDETKDTELSKFFLDGVYSGTYYLNVRPVDEAGNAGDVVSKEIVMDYSSSSININAIPGARLVNGVYYTRDDSLILNGVSSFTPASSRLYLYDAQDTALGSSTAFNVDENLEFRQSVDVFMGENHFYIYGDDSGNVAYNHIIIEKDYVAPEIDIYPLDLLSMESQITVETDEISVCTMSYMTTQGHTNTQDFVGEFTEIHTLVLEEPLLIDNNGMAAITVACSDPAGNIATEYKTIRIDFKPPVIQSFDVDGHEEAENEFKIVKENLALITVNADEFVRCKYDYQDKSFEEMEHFSDDYDKFLLHPRIAIRLRPDSEEDTYDETIYVKCQDKSTKISDTSSVLLHVRLNEPIIVFDPLPSGSITDLNPKISVKTYRDAECTATFSEDSSSDGAFAFIWDFFRRVLSASDAKLEKSYEGNYYYHSTDLSKSDYFQNVALNMNKTYTFDVKCDSDKYPSGENQINFKINYIDSLAPVATIYILG